MPRPDAATSDVLEAIHAIMHLYRARQFRALREAGDELTHMESKVLGHVVRMPGIAQGELAARMGRDKGQLARLIGGLKERGFIESQPDESDRRSMRLHATEAAQALDQAVRRQARRLSALAVTGLAADERQQLLDLLARVRVNLEGADES